MDTELLAVAAECESALDPLLLALEDLDARLDVGMVIAEYRVGVQDASAAYNRTDFSSFDIRCIIASGVRAENALNAYIQAVERWGDCISDFGCSTESIEPQLQRHWRKATRLITQARRGFAKIERGEITGLGE